MLVPNVRGLGRNLKGDIFGGITSSVVALPLALAFGMASGAGAIAGLYSAIFTGIISALFGGVPAQITGPTGGMTVVLVGVYKELGIEGLFMAMFLAGIIQIVISFFRIGKYIHFLPHPVIAGFTNGIAILIFSQQVATLRTGGAIDWYGVAVAAAVIAIMALWPKITKAVPGSLIALLLTTVVVAVMFKNGELSLLGAIPSGLPKPSLGFLATQWGNLPKLVKPAIMIAMLGIIESLLSALVIDEMAGTKHKSDKEIFGQGVGNAVATLFGGVAGTGAIVRSAVNVRSGGRTPLSGIIHGLLILLATASLGKYAAYVPKATLAGILMMTAIGMVDWESVKDLRRAPWADSAVMLVTAGLTVFTDLVTAVAVGMMMSMALFSARMSTAPVFSRKTGHVQVISLTGPFFFGTSKRFADEVEACAPGSVQVWDLSDVTSIDATGAVVIRKAYRSATDKDSTVLIVGLKENVRGVLEKLGVLDEIASHLVVQSVHEAMKVAPPAVAATEA